MISKRTLATYGFWALWGLIFIMAVSVEKGLAQSKILKEYKSLYRNVTVIETAHTRCVRLKNKKNPFNSQSCLNLSRPHELLFFYSQAMMAALSTQNDGIKILSVGLGGGTMPRVIESYFKKADITTVEIDSKMFEAAEEFMQFKTSAANRVVIQDARYFIRKQGYAKVQYDVVLLDAFNGEYIPEHLTTREFLEEVKKILKPNGLLLSNTFSFRDFYNSESVTYEAVFPDFCAFKSASARTVVAFNGAKCDAKKLSAGVEKNFSTLSPYIQNVKNIHRSITDQKDWDGSARIFTDEFSPANLYNAH